MEMSRLTRDGTAEPVSRDQILRRERGQENIIFPCSAELDHVQGWQPYSVDPSYFCYMCDQYESIQCNNHMHANLLHYARGTVSSDHKADNSVFCMIISNSPFSSK